MPIRRTPEFTQFESVKSMMRNFPPNGTAGFARQSVSGPSRAPRPPARIIATVLRVSCGMFGSASRCAAARASASGAKSMWPWMERLSSSL